MAPLSSSNSRESSTKIDEEAQPSDPLISEHVELYTESKIDDYIAPLQPSTTTGQQILLLAIPALGALLIDPIMNLTDTTLVGRYSDGANQLAGMGSATALLSFSFYIFNFLCMAVTPLVGSKRAAGNEEGAIQTGGQALSLSIILGVLLTCFLLGYYKELLHIMGTHVAGEEAEKYAIDFFIVRALAAPAVLSIYTSTGILRGYLDTSTPIYILLFANVINLSLDFILIPRYGPRGAAIATTTAEFVSAIAFMGILAGELPSLDGKMGSNQKGENPVYVLPHLSIPTWKDIKPLIIASSSLFMRSLFLQLSLSLAAALATRAGAPSVAAHQIGIQLWMLCCQISDALEAAAQALIADAIGRKDEVDVRRVSSVIFCYASILGFFLAGVLAVGQITGFWIHFFTFDTSTQMQLSSILIIIIVAQPMNSLVFAADGVLQGASEFAFQAKAMAISAFGACGFFLMTGSLFDKSNALVHIWLALIVLQILRGLTSLYKLVDKDGPINMLAK